MIITELIQTIVTTVSDTAGSVPDVLASSHKPKQPTGINTEGVVKFLLSRIAPIFLAVLGLIFIGRAGKGEVSKVVTSSAIAIVGLAFIGGALALIFLGSYLVDLFFT